MCDHCSAEGPPASQTEASGGRENRLRPRAIGAWNKRGFDGPSYRIGIKAAASFVKQFDAYVSNPYLLSDCILKNFNLIGKRKVRKNSRNWVKASYAAIRYFQQICFGGGKKKIVRAGEEFDQAMRELFGVRSSKKFDLSMKALFNHIDRRTPARRKGQRRKDGDPDSAFGTILRTWISRERREQTRRAGAWRRSR